MRRADVAVALSQEMAEMNFHWTPGEPEHLHLFEDIGLDSLDGFELALAMRQRFSVVEERAYFARTFTIRSVIEAACDVLRTRGELEQ